MNLSVETRKNLSKLLFTLLGVCIPFLGRELWTRTFGADYEVVKQARAEEHALIRETRVRLDTLDKREESHHQMNRGNWQTHTKSLELVREALKDVKHQNDLILIWMQAVRFAQPPPSTSAYPALPSDTLPVWALSQRRKIKPK